MITVEPIEQVQFSACFCCVRPTDDLRGAVYADDRPHALYSLEPRGEGEARRVLLTIALGPWEEGTGPADRRIVSFAGRGSAEAFEPADDKAEHWDELLGAGEPVDAAALAAQRDFGDIRALALTIAGGDPRIGPALAAAAGRRAFVADAPGPEGAQ